MFFAKNQPGIQLEKASTPAIAGKAIMTDWEYSDLANLECIADNANLLHGYFPRP
jgi:hypothetical protein